MEEELTNSADKVNEYSKIAFDYLIEYGPKVIMAVIALIIGFWLAGKVKRGFIKALDKRDFDPTLKPFIGNIVGWLFKILVVISVASMVGIETTSFIAVLGAAGLAVGLALQGTLANFAGGVLLLILKPFKVDDVIDGAGYMGVVEEITLFYTKMRNFQNREIVIPNARLSNDSIVNYSAKEIARVDMVFGIGYGSDLKRAKEILTEMVEKDERCLDDPAPTIVIGELADSSVNILCRPWTKVSDYWPTYWDFMEQVKLRFDAEGIEIPFPQRDVHMIKED
ncbi:mechanosensitive ion channel domain-containing protein [Salibacter sp.]|jgi:small conductance mechanosensitive channel|uniref:mechanosensitive ion channel family protein n=1 Tax=Salibacter sp. TaxID=2010995 RepID=UPI0028708F41|nr:mechanosensitive ion channel domain-containing protein [Salibacter sp.]MDR9487883.1 mechanosensitive ion channel [Salibacter sp.]